MEEAERICRDEDEHFSKINLDIEADIANIKAELSEIETGIAKKRPVNATPSPPSTEDNDIA